MIKIEPLTPFEKMLLEHAMDYMIKESGKGPQRGPNIIPQKTFDSTYKEVKKKLKIA